MGTWAHRGSVNSGFSGMVDARERVTGRVPYVINLTLPGMLHARLLRSPAPHAPDYPNSRWKRSRYRRRRR